MKWRYGIIKYKVKEYEHFGIGELYFDSDPLKPHSYSESITLCVDGDSENPKEDLLNIIKMIHKDIERFPVFDSSKPFEMEQNDSKD